MRARPPALARPAERFIRVDRGPEVFQLFPFPLLFLFFSSCFRKQPDDYPDKNRRCPLPPVRARLAPLAVLLSLVDASGCVSREYIRKC